MAGDDPRMATTGLGLHRLVAAPRASFEGHPLAGKHLLIVTADYAPTENGVAPYATQMAEHLAERAASVTVLTATPGDSAATLPPARSSDTGGIQPHVLRLGRRRPAGQATVTRTAHELTFLAQALRTKLPYPPDLVAAVTPHLSGAFAAARLAHRHIVPLVVIVTELHGDPMSRAGAGQGRARLRTAVSTQRYVLRRAAHVAVASETFRDGVLGYDVQGHRIHVLPSWTHTLTSEDERGAVRRGLGWPQGAFIVAHPTPVAAGTDTATVIEAARLLGEDTQVVLFADGPARTDAEQRIQVPTNVRVLEPLDDLQAPLAALAADVLLVAETADAPLLGGAATFGHTAAALTGLFHAGRPIVAAVSEDGLTAAHLRPAEAAALVVRPGDPEALADAVRQLHHDPGHRAAMGSAALQYVNIGLGRAASLARIDALMGAALPGPPLAARLSCWP